MNPASMLRFTRKALTTPVRHLSTGEKLTHLDASGQASMVDVRHKASTHRTAHAGATVVVGSHVYRLLQESLSSPSTIRGKPYSAKGDVFTVAQLAGITAAKQTSSLIPLCHSVPLAHISVDLTLAAFAPEVHIVATATTAPAQTGVEMEALTAASVAALTVYDMCKAGSKEMKIENIRLLSKTGGRSGDWTRPGEDDVGSAGRQP